MAGVTTVQAAERALDAVTPGGVKRVHVYADVTELEVVMAQLEGDGFEVVQRPARRYDYREGRWFWQTEMAHGFVAVHLRDVAES